MSTQKQFVDARDLPRLGRGRASSVVLCPEIILLSAFQDKLQAKKVPRHQPPRHGRRPTIQRPPQQRQQQQPAPAGVRGTFWLYGVHAVKAALGNPARRKRRVIATESSSGSHLAGVDVGSIAVEIVSRERLDQFVPGVHQGIAIEVYPLDNPPLGEVLDRADTNSAVRKIALVLDQVTDPQNVGATLRLAAAFGACAVIATDRHAPHETGSLAKAASGALDLVPYARVVNLSRALAEFGERGFWRVGLDSAGESVLDGPRAPAAVALVLGAEGTGLRRLTRENCDALCRIATPPGLAMPSLNVAHAAAIGLYELRQS